MPVANRVTALAVVIFLPYIAYEVRLRRQSQQKSDCVGSRTKKCDESALRMTALAVTIKVLKVR